MEAVVKKVVEEQKQRSWRRRFTKSGGGSHDFSRETGSNSGEAAEQQGEGNMEEKVADKGEMFREKGRSEA